jgi:hypothetical protein
LLGIRSLALLLPTCRETKRALLQTQLPISGS